jgi:mRNA interferase RelE/StbE
MTDQQTYHVNVSPAAARQLRKIDLATRRRIVAAIDRLTITPRPVGCRALTGHPGLLRIRIGDFRVVYTVRDAQLVILVIAVANRRDVYRDFDVSRRKGSSSSLCDVSCESPGQRRGIRQGYGQPTVTVTPPENIES